jgi:hypothetical protein
VRQLVDSAVCAGPQWAGQALGLTRRPKLADGYERVYLHHIRKTGGTSISTAFMALGGEDPATVERRIVRVRPHVTRTGDAVIAAHDRFALQTGGYSYGWSHMPAWKLRLPPRTYTVTVLRDPVARVLSLYRYLCDPDSDRGHAFAAPASDRAWVAGGFDSFLEVMPRGDLLNQLFMFSPRLDPEEAATAISGCSLVFQLSDMSQGVATLSELLGRPLRESNERRSPPSTFKPSDEQMTRLRSLLEPEYELLQLLEPRWSGWRLELHRQL